MTDEKRINIETGKPDVGAMVVRGTVGLIPVLGPILGEIITHFIPNQRQDRISDYIQRLDVQLSDLHEQIVREKMKDASAIDLFEEGGFQSARALSDKRRDEVSALVAYGIRGEDKERIEAKRLLLLFREVDDDQIVILCSYLRRYQQDEMFQERHRHILDPFVAHLGSDDEEFDRATMYELSKQQLCSLGLLSTSFKSIRKGEIPEFDSNTGMMKASYTQISPLGRLLLRRVGLADDNDY
ncbi:hypothetical protein JJB09_18535 [Rhizobium sp. KVB221]|uniref:Uncharacterized protein n=1 Tax=Rhizobium setariae TaxID=2801340 RepID=A0A936YVF1_9HYPH|nr:hypothetical protein [Rhizobium setariae]MBL0374022.1 hypothetical protein [Rhizobium setariae]